MREKLKLIAAILFAKRMHIVEHSDYTLLRIGGKGDNGITKITKL